MTRKLVAIVLVAALARVAAVVVVHRIPLFRGVSRSLQPAVVPIFPDSLEYLKVADNILAGRGLMVDQASRIGRMPGYPVFLAAVRGVWGESLLAARLAQVVVGVAGVWLVWLLARAVYGEREAVAAAAIAAVYPLLVLHTPLLLAETVFITLLLWGLLSLRAAAAEQRLGSAALAGLALGLATLVRASLLPFVPLAAVVWVARWRLRRRAVQGAAVLVGVFAAAIAPWVVRNYHASGGHFVPTTCRAGPSLYEALNPEADGAPMMDRIDWGWGTSGLSEWEQHRLWQRRAVAWAAANPGRVAALAARKFVRFWNVLPNAPEFRRPLVLACVGISVPYVVVVALAIVGLASSWRRAEVRLILLLPVVYYALLHMVFVASLRYRVAVMPLAIVLAGRGLMRLSRRVWPEAAGGGGGPAQ